MKIMKLWTLKWPFWTPLFIPEANIHPLSATSYPNNLPCNLRTIPHAHTSKTADSVAVKIKLTENNSHPLNCCPFSGMNLLTFNFNDSNRPTHERLEHLSTTNYSLTRYIKKYSIYIYITSFHSRIDICKLFSVFFSFFVVRVKWPHIKSVWMYQHLKIYNLERRK